MRNYGEELEKRVEWVREILRKSGAKGVVYGNSGGKDCSLASVICKKATDNVLGVIMPCQSSQNYGSDFDDAKRMSEQYGIENIVVDLTGAKKAMTEALSNAGIGLTSGADANVAPRLRMTTLYAIGHKNNYLVCGTGNRSERYLGYFTKWGDGACDFNPIADLTVAEVYEFLRYLGAPATIIGKRPSAGLFEGQTDEGEMGITYGEVDKFLAGGETDERTLGVITRMHNSSEHKRNGVPLYGF